MTKKNKMITAQNTVLIVLAAVFIIFISYRFLRRGSLIPSFTDSSVLMIGTNIEYPPFSFNKDNELAGFDIDVAQDVARRLGKKAEFKTMSFDALIPEVQLGNIQIIAAGMTPTPERAKRVIFTRPHFQGTPLAIVTLDNKPTYDSLDSLKGKRVVVNQGYYSDTFMSAINGIELLRVGGANISEGILALQSDRADAYITSIASLKPLEAQNKLESYKITPIKSSDEMIALIISKKHAYLEKPIQDILNAMQEDGTLEALEKKWKLK